ncbi:hypothetical protein Tco_1390351 [Tanacetum coccineum]
MATINRTPYTITEASVRSQLQLGDDGGIEDLPIGDVYLGMDNLGYPTEGKLTFYKNKFLPQWRFLVHTIQHCLNTKTGSWDQFGSPLVIVLICLSNGRWFLQIILGITTRNTKQYHVLKLSSKLFANMRLNFVGDHMPLLDAMLPPAQAAISDEGAHASDPDLFTSTTMEDEPLGGSFHTTPPRSTPVSPIGPTSGGAKDLVTLTDLSSLVSELVQKVIKALEVKLNTKKRKVVLSDSDQEDGGEPNVDLDALNALANAAVTVDSTKSPSGPSKKPAACSYDPTSDVPTTEVPSTEFPVDVPSDGAPTDPSTVSPGSTTVPTGSSVFAAATIPASSGTTPKTPSSPVRDARKGKGVAVEEPTLTLDKTFKQLEEERLGWEAAQRLQTQELADFEKQRAESLMERPMTPSQLRQYMRTYVKNQGPAVYSTGWTMAQVRKLSPEQLQEEFDKIQRAIAFTRGLKRYGSSMTRASSKKLKTSDDEANVEAPSHSVSQEEESSTPSQNVSREEVAAPSPSPDISDAQVEVASTAQHTASSLKTVGTRKKRLGRKGVHTSPSTIPIEEGDPDAEHKMCIKYAFDADSASDDDTTVNLFDVVDWELLFTGLGSINAFYRLDNSRKYFTSLREILYLGDLKVLIDSPKVNDGSDVWKNQHTWSIQSWKLYSFSGVHVLETVSGLILHMFVDKKYLLSINLIKRMLDHELEISHGTVGNELTTAVQLIAFLKKQISNSKRPKVHDWYC